MKKMIRNLILAAVTAGTSVAQAQVNETVPGDVFNCTAKQNGEKFLYNADMKNYQATMGSIEVTLQPVRFQKRLWVSITAETLNGSFFLTSGLMPVGRRTATSLIGLIEHHGETYSIFCSLKD